MMDELIKAFPQEKNKKLTVYAKNKDGIRRVTVNLVIKLPEGCCEEMQAAAHKYVQSSNAICWTNISDVAGLDVSVSKSSFALKRYSWIQAEGDAEWISCAGRQAELY